MGEGNGGTRSYDILLLGATGYTGRLVAEYLAERAPEGLRWALAGRSREKLEAVRRDLAATSARLASLPLEVVDVGDEGALRALAARSRVLCTTVGPYARYGGPVVAACVEAGTDYCDLTGEVHWMRETIDAHHARARERGVRIVHTCGFDSIPSDLGVYMLGEAMAERGAQLRSVAFYAGESKGGVSGGTIASMLALFEAIERDPGLRRVVGHPYALNPEGEREGPDRGDPMGVRYDAELGMWTAPFVMAAVNTRVVRRSNALRGYPFGRDFRYSEQMSTGRGPRGLLRATAVTAGLGGFVAAVGVRPLRALLERRVLPAPGAGPSKEEREAGYFVIRLVAHGRRLDDGADVALRGRVEGTRDPGYGETAKMLGESALCLALDRDRLSAEGGVLTPSVAMGAPLLDRLRAAGMVFRVEDPAL